VIGTSLGPYKIIEQLGAGGMGVLLQDFRYAARSLRNTPGFTAVAVLTLAFGIGATTAIFSLVYGVMLRPLPFPQPDQLVDVWELPDRTDPDQMHLVSPPNFIDFREQSETFEGFAAFVFRFVNVTGGDAPERLDGLMVSPNFFDVLGVEAIQGRTFVLDGDAAAQPTVVLGQGLWQRRYGSDPTIIGEQISLDGVSHTVVGVVPSSVRSSTFWKTELWLRAPRGIPNPNFIGDDDDDFLTRRGSTALFVFGRIKPAVTLQQARAEMDTIAQRLADEYPDTNAGKGVRLVPLSEVGDARQDLLVLFGAVTFVLLIACANVANLILARAAGRERELAVRTALGAGRSRLIRQLLAESVILSVLGGALGVLLASWSMDSLLALNPDTLPRQQELGVDRWVLGFTLLLSMLTALGSGLAPALHASRSDLRASLAQGRRGSRGQTRQGLQRSLVVAQIALALVLLVGAGLLGRTFLALQRVAPGFESQGVLVLSVFLPESRYAGDTQLTAFYTEVVERLASVPGVRSATAVSMSVPFRGMGMTGDFSIEGRPPLPSGEKHQAILRGISPSYFRTMGIPILSGRSFVPADEAAARKVAVINQTMSRRFWPNESPLGRRFGGEDDWAEIVGVVGDVKNDGLEREPRPQTYFPLALFPLRYVDLVVKTGSDPVRLAEAVRTAVRAVDADLPVIAVQPLDRIVGQSVADRRFNTLVLAVFAGLAIVLAAVGVYALMAHSVSQRTSELGIRIALGARTADVYAVVLREGLVLSLLGAAIGTAGAFWITRLLGSELYGVTASDPLTFAAGVVGLVSVALLACYIPARRATKVDPLVALRAE